VELITDQSWWTRCSAAAGNDRWLNSPSPNPKGHAYQSAFLRVMYFMLHFDMLIPHTSSVQNVRKSADCEIRENRKAMGKELR